MPGVGGQLHGSDGPRSARYGLKWSATFLIATAPCDLGFVPEPTKEKPSSITTFSAMRLAKPPSSSPARYRSLCPRQMNLHEPSLLRKRRPVTMRHKSLAISLAFTESYRATPA